MCASEVGEQQRCQGSGQRTDPALVTPAIVGGYCTLSEIKVSDAQAHALNNAQARSVHDLGGELPGVFQTGDDHAHFVTGHYKRRAAASAVVSDVFEADMFESEVLNAEDLSGEEDHGLEGLLAGGRGDVALPFQGVEERGDRQAAGVARGLFERRQTEAGEADGPMDVGPLGGFGEVGNGDCLAQGVDDVVDLGISVGQGPESSGGAAEGLARTWMVSRPSVRWSDLSDLAWSARPCQS